MTRVLTSRSHAESFQLGKFLPFRLTVLSNQLTRRVARSYRERFNLTAPEWRVIAVLGESGALTANRVIEVTTMDKVRVSRAVAKLLKTGLITRVADPKDRRRAILDLTSKGKQIYAQIVPMVQEIEAEILATISPADRAALDRVLSMVESHLTQSADDDPSDLE